MTTSQRCPIYLNRHGTNCESSLTSGDFYSCNCEYCGAYEVTRSAYVTYLEEGKNHSLNPIQRAALSHKVRVEASVRSKQIRLTAANIEQFLLNAFLPSPIIQATNFIRLVGDYLIREGTPLPAAVGQSAMIGAFDPAAKERLISALVESELVKTISVQKPIVSYPALSYEYDLTFAGWERYESERRGKFAGNYGFLAMQFANTVLDDFVESVLKPCVKNALKFEIIDMRDASRAGIIDNIMRAQIRDSAFVVADLTHDNPGAYWEAGYAEGLGKPVIYICEKTKFEERKSHFDTNHCTTVTWCRDDDSTFQKDFVATLRRSLNLFET